MNGNETVSQKCIDTSRISSKLISAYIVVIAWCIEVPRSLYHVYENSLAVVLLFCS